MSDALEALRARFPEPNSLNLSRDHDGSVMMSFTPEEYDAIRAALEQKAEPYRWLVIWPSGGEEIQRKKADAERWTQVGASVVPVYIAPPSTAEAQARQLEKLDLYIMRMANATQLGHENQSLGASTFNWLLRFREIIREFAVENHLETKRIREEG